MSGGRGPAPPEDVEAADVPSGGEGVTRPRRAGLLAAVAAVVLAADAVTKALAVSRLGDASPVELPGGVLTLQLVRNSGAAFGVGSGFTVAFTLISIVVALVILRVAVNVRHRAWAVTLGLLLGGALGNLGDRLLRPPGPLRGHVVDWIQLPHWPVFNLADTAIVCGGVLAVILAIRGMRVDGTRVQAP